MNYLITYLPSYFTDMRIDSTVLLKLPVVTQDGRRVGHVTGLCIDTEHHGILFYRVCPGACLVSVFHRRRKTELLIAPSQVLAIREDAVVVDANLPEERLRSFASHAAANAPTLTPVGVSACKSAS